MPIFVVGMNERVHINPSEFIVSDGSMEALPYESSRELNCKLRWRGKSVGEIFKTEFGKDHVYVKTACLNGKILVNGRMCSEESIVNNGDVLSHHWMACEPNLDIPNNQMPAIVYKQGNLLVAYKPHSLPTTPQGVFFRTNLVYILKSYLGVNFLQPINRLDRAVAGLVVLATDPAMKIEVIEKVYIAQVINEFPRNIQGSQAKLRVEKHVANQVLKTVIDEDDGVESETMFRALNSDLNLVECRPVTGRTHQIRVHLSGLGFPILGDTLYDGSITNLDKQPDMIHLFSFQYTFKISEAEVVSVKCPEDLFPSWISPQCLNRK